MKKRCPKCKAVYEEENLNFCPKDGSTLESMQEPLEKVRMTGNQQRKPDEKAVFGVPAVIVGVLAVLLVAGGLLVYTGKVKLPVGQQEDEQQEAADAATENSDEKETASVSQVPEDRSTADSISADTETSEAGETVRESDSSAEVMQKQTEERIDALQQKVENEYDGLRVEYLAKDETGYQFDVFKNDKWFGRVSVDPDTEKISVLRGMTDSAVADLDTGKISKKVSAEAGKGKYSYAVIDLATGDIRGTSNMDQGKSASVMIDIPILYTICKGLEDGSMDLSEPVTFHYEVDGRGKLGRSEDGSSYTMEEMAEYMLQYSDNNATNSLLSYLGYDLINNTCAKNGYLSVKIVSKIAKTKDYTEQDNYVSAEDLAGMLKEIWNSDQEINQNFLEKHMIIQDSTRTNGIGKNIDTGNFLNLNGQKADKYNETAVITDEDKSYGLVFLGYQGEVERLRNAAAEFGSAAYQELR